MAGRTAAVDRAPPTDASSAVLVDRRELAGRQLLTFHRPSAAAAGRAGQVIHVRTTDGSGLTWRRLYAIHTADPGSGSLSILAGSDSGDPWVERLRPGDPVALLGPYGRPFEADPRSRHLLLVAEGPGIAGLRMLVDEAIRDGRQVALLLGAPSAQAVYPSSLLPDEVEYVVATDDGSLGYRGAVTDLVPAYEAWADQAFAAGPPMMLATMARIAAGRRARLGVATLGRKRGGGKVDPPGTTAARRKAFLQVLVEQTYACALGTCLGCVVPGADGIPLRACREGPVFAAEELVL